MGATLAERLLNEYGTVDRDSTSIDGGNDPADRLIRENGLSLGDQIRVIDDRLIRIESIIAAERGSMDPHIGEALMVQID